MTNPKPGEYLLDTSILVLCLRQRHDIIARVNALPTAYTSPHIISELTYGAYRSPNPAKALADVNALERKYPTVVLDADIGYLAGQIEYQLRTAGQMIPEGDIWIAATAIGYQFTLVAHDAHFYRVAGLSFVHW